MGVKPEYRPFSVVGWLLPERVIREIVEQRRWVRETRRIEEWISLTDFAYSMPRLPEIEQKPEVFATGIDTDGWLEERFWGKDRIGEMDRAIWRYEYNTPEIGFSTDDFELTKKVANMLIENITPRRPQPPLKPKVMYETTSYTQRATRAILLAEPYLIKWRRKADELLERYRQRPTRRLS